MHPLREILINKSNAKGLAIDEQQRTETQATVALCELSDEQAFRNAFLEGLSPWNQQEKIFNKVKQQLKKQLKQQFKRQFKQELKQQLKQQFEAPSKQIMGPMQAGVAQRSNVKREVRREKTQAGANRKCTTSNKENEGGRDEKKEQGYPQASQAYRRIAYPKTDECTQIITCLKRKMPLLKAGGRRQQRENLESAMVCNIGANAGQLWLQSAESIKSIQSIQSTYLTQSTLEEQIPQFPGRDVTNGQFWRMKPKRKDFRLKSLSGTRKQFLNTPIRISLRKRRLSTQAASTSHPPNYHTLNPLTRILYQKYAEALSKENPKTKGKSKNFENLRARISGATQCIQKRSFSEGREGRERESLGGIEGLGQTEGLGRMEGRRDGGVEMRPCWS